MGVVNVTPDSFSAGGRFLRTGDALQQALSLADQGADIVDTGGESTRPGADAMSEAEELERAAQVVELVASEIDTRISIDTYKPQVAAECFSLGAGMVNDITGLEHPDMIRVAKEADAGVVAMHMRGRPQTMQSAEEIVYDDLIGDISAFLSERGERARAAGIKERIIDPGIGFGKTPAQHFELLQRLLELTVLGYPVLVGPSRKSFLGALPSGLPTDERLEGTLAAVAVAVMNGASIVRVHDVGEVRRVVEVVDAVLSA